MIVITSPPLIQPEYQSDRMLLRQYRKTDAEDMFAYSSNPEVTKFLRFETHTNISQAAQYIDKVLAECARGVFSDWAIEWKADGKMIGAVSLRSWVPEHHQAELSGVVNPAYRGLGVMPEALTIMQEYCFEVIELERLEGRHILEHVTMEKVCTKAGMTYEGTLRSLQLIKGKYLDFKIYSILRSEYFARKEQNV